MEFILCRDLSEQEKMNFLADVIDEEKKNELNTITVRLHRDINGKVDPEGIEVETSITPVEIHLMRMAKWSFVKKTASKLSGPVLLGT